MQNNEEARDLNAESEADALKRILSGESPDSLEDDTTAVGKALVEEAMRVRGQTGVAMPDVESLTAAKRFEVFVAKHFPDAKFEKHVHDFLSEVVIYELTVRRFHLTSEEDTLREFCDIIKDAQSFWVGSDDWMATGEDRPEGADENVCVSIKFRTTLRFKK